MKRLTTQLLSITLFGAFVFGAAPAQAQVSFEARGGLQAPTGDFGDAVDSEAGFGVDVFYNLNPRLSVYGGYGIENFEEDVESKGFEAGVKFLLRSELEGIQPWIRGGAIFHELEVPSGVTSDRGVGFQISGGADIPLGEVVSFAPALRYQSYSPDFDSALGDIEETVSFVSFDFGIHVHPGF